MPGFIVRGPPIAADRTLWSDIVPEHIQADMLASDQGKIDPEPDHKMSQIGAIYVMNEESTGDRGVSRWH